MLTYFYWFWEEFCVPPGLEYMFPSARWGIRQLQFVEINLFPLCPSCHLLVPLLSMYYFTLWKCWVLKISLGDPIVFFFYFLASLFSFIFHITDFLFCLIHSPSHSLHLGLNLCDSIFNLGPSRFVFFYFYSEGFSIVFYTFIILSSIFWIIVLSSSSDIWIISIVIQSLVVSMTYISLISGEFLHLIIVSRKEKKKRENIMRWIKLNKINFKRTKNY